MTSRWLAAFPSLILALAVIGARVSGNDKAPFLVLAVLALTALSGLGAFLIALRGGEAGTKAGWLCLGTLIPLIYAALVLLLSRRHIVDSLNWLGFR